MIPHIRSLLMIRPLRSALFTGLWMFLLLMLGEQLVQTFRETGLGGLRCRIYTLKVTLLRPFCFPGL